MSLKLSSLKKWLTLEDSAKYLSLALGEPVETRDLIQLSLENSLALSVMLPDTVMAVKYRHNPHAHEPEPPMSNGRDISELLRRLDLMARLSWAAFLDRESVFEPDFEEVRHVSGLWGLPCLERSNNITLLGSRLKSALTQSHISHETKPGFGPIIIQNSTTDELWGLVEFSYDSFEDEDDDDDRKPSRKDYAPICELPESAHIGVSQTELQRFIGALQEAESTTESDPDRQHYPPQLEALTIAWRKYWQNADPTDRSACPKKPDVVDWLIAQGFSAKNADAGATIIKPQWAIDKGW